MGLTIYIHVDSAPQEAHNARVFLCINFTHSSNEF